MQTTRRDLLQAGATAAAAGVAALSGCRPTGADAGSSGVHYGMVIDLQKCIGCKTCAVACKAENHTPPGVNYMVVLEEEIGTYPNVERRFIPRPCMQCQQPSCTQVCPTRATYQRHDGVVAIDYDKCIGCRYCMAACPYGARSFDFGHDYYSVCRENTVLHEGVFAGSEPMPYEATPSPEYGENRLRQPRVSPVNNVRKCHFCLHRVRKGMLPACAAACPGRAIYFGDLNDARSLVYRIRDGDDPAHVVFPHFRGRHVMQLKPETGNDPSVYYLT
ncbi:MAG: hypothetical protein KatS3mg110_3239 [Pirellulaceae bacterium]|nr:MAG: hypothetical protein KatS3mg110_3239 [Pirellulaceae bacterium]